MPCNLRTQPIRSWSLKPAGMTFAEWTFSGTLLQIISIKVLLSLVILVGVVRGCFRPYEFIIDLISL